MDKPRRIGVFGGTFDPIHKGHLAIAQTAQQQAQLDRVLFVIAANPPHKNDVGLTPAPLRVAMTEAAIEAFPGFEVCRIELDRSGPSYTVDTLTRLHEELTPEQLFFIAGYDSAIDLPGWRHPQEIVRLAKLLVAPRPENKAPLPALVAENCQLLRMDEYPVSSSEIREGIARGEDMSAWLPTGTQAVIDAKGLYRAHNRHA